MARRKLKSGYKSHDIEAQWLDENGTTHREIVGMRSQTNTGDNIEILFVTFPMEYATIIATPVKKGP